MANVLINEDTMHDIAKAIRDKTGKSEQMLPGEMAGKIQDISDSGQFDKLLLKTIEKAVLPESLTEISNSAFYNCTSLALESLPSGLTSIGSYAFQNCTSLTIIKFNSTPTISVSAFMGCKNLKTINVPWSKGDPADANAPWGAPNVETINYNYTGDEDA